MKFPGFHVSSTKPGEVLIRKCFFDETELTPESNWKEIHENAKPDRQLWGGTDLEAALSVAARTLKESETVGEN